MRFYLKYISTVFKFPSLEDTNFKRTLLLLLSILSLNWSNAPSSAHILRVCRWSDDNCIMTVLVEMGIQEDPLSLRKSSVFFFLFNSLFSLDFKKCMRYWPQTKQKLNFWMLEDLSILKAIEGGTGGVWILKAFCYIYIFINRIYSLKRCTRLQDAP